MNTKFYAIALTKDAPQHYRWKCMTDKGFEFQKSPHHSKVLLVRYGLTEIPEVIGLYSTIGWAINRAEKIYSEGVRSEP